MKRGILVYIGLFIAICMHGVDVTPRDSVSVFEQLIQSREVATPDGSMSVDSIGIVEGVDTTAVAAERREVKKLLVLGDSMTGWIGERLAAYGRENGYEVATVVWDGSTIGKWAGASQKIRSYVSAQNPDLIVISLGMNEMLERNPAGRLDAKVDKILSAFGDVPYLWIGPPSWPGKASDPNALDQYLKEKTGEGNYYQSITLDLPRQSKSNPHPTRGGIMQWVDGILESLQEREDISIGNEKPTGAEMMRGKTHIYRKMNQKL